ncbi:MAG: hypothetical protein HS129_05915 [Leptospiraceae bacterium]|nr:hypothetical protein [Leptospiraceae bacterium]
MVFILVFPKSDYDLHFGSDQAELYSSASKILNLKLEFIGHPSVWGFSHPGPALRIYFQIVYLLSFGNIFLFFLVDTLFKLSLLFYSKNRLSKTLKINLDIPFLFMLSSSYFIFLIKTPWAHGIVAVGFFLCVVFLVEEKYVHLFVLLNILIQVNIISVIPFAFIVLINFKNWVFEIRDKFMKYSLIVLILWSLPVFEVLKNKGGNFLKIFTVVFQKEEYRNLTVSSNIVSLFINFTFLCFFLLYQSFLLLRE